MHSKRPIRTVGEPRSSAHDQDGCHIGTQADGGRMSYRVVTTLRFTDHFSKMTEQEQQNEQLAALDIVTRNGGTIDTIMVVPDDAVALVHAQYPDERAAAKSHLQIQARGAYNLSP